jgi:hypothetical protein
MNISDEQYEEMELRIEELTLLLSYVVSGKTVRIEKRNLEIFEAQLKSDMSLIISVDKDGNHYVKVVVDVKQQ